VADAIVVPEPALTTRDGREGLFVLAPDGASVVWRPVQVGIRDGRRAQVLDGGELAGQRIVTLGQQLLDDGSAVLLPADDIGLAETDGPEQQARAGRTPR
jgi:multidrug efflux pump subunit AcrA (membrane-fusion protein)